MARPIVVIGSSNADFIMKMDHLPKVGETVTDALFLQTFGGKGANQAVGAARSGGEVIFVNRVGDDLYGKLIRENLRAAGVNVDYVLEETDIASGTALVMVGGEGQNYLSVAPGANYRLSPAAVDDLHAVIRDAALVVLQYEIPTETLQRTIDLAFHMGKKIMLNLAPARALAERYLRYLYVLVVNESEAEFLVGYPVDGLESARRAAMDLKARGPLYVVVTLGAQGSYVAGPDVDLAVPAFPVQAVDTTAAGDIYCGSLAVALVEGRSMPDAVRFASAAAAVSVTRLGAQPSAPNRAEIEALL
jgi:ribokinase